MEGNRKKGENTMLSQTIHVPFNESTVHIYEAYVKVAKEIAARSDTSQDTKADVGIA